MSRSPRPESWCFLPISRVAVTQLRFRGDGEAAALGTGDLHVVTVSGWPSESPTFSGHLVRLYDPAGGITVARHRALGVPRRTNNSSSRENTVSPRGTEQRSSESRGWERGQSVLSGRFPSVKVTIFTEAGGRVSCRRQQLGKLGPQPRRRCDCIEQPTLPGMSLLGCVGVAEAAVALNPPPEGGHSAPRLYCFVFSQAPLLPEEGGEEHVYMPGVGPSWG